MGQASSLLTLGVLLLAPLYGWLLDSSRPALTLVLALSLCGVGCTLRALAVGPASVLVAAAVMSVDGSFESLVLAFVSKRTPLAHRAQLVSGFLASVQASRRRAHNSSDPRQFVYGVICSRIKLGHNVLGESRVNVSYLSACQLVRVRQCMARRGTVGVAVGV